MRPKYDILITNYNTSKTIRESLESILSQIDNNFSVTLVDNNSNDGSEEIIKEFQKQIKLISTKCSRGKGRQIAFENSRGEILITNMDMDTIFKSKLMDILKEYHLLDDKYGRITLSFNGGSIVSRELIEEVGGWHDLQRGEDTELMVRFEQIDVIHLKSDINLVEQHLLSWNQKGHLYLLYDKYILLRDKMRVGIGAYELFRSSMRNGLWKNTFYGSFLFVFLLMLAKIAYKLKVCYSSIEATERFEDERRRL